MPGPALSSVVHSTCLPKQRETSLTRTQLVWAEASCHAMTCKSNNFSYMIVIHYILRCVSVHVLAMLCRKQAACDYHSDKLLRHSLLHWQLCAKWGKDSGWKEDLAFDHWSETMLVKAVDSWQLVGASCSLVSADLVH